MKKLMFCLVIVSLVGSLFSGEWEKTGNINLNVSQSSYSENWQGEESSSLTWILNGNFSAQKQLNPKLHNKNTLKLSFGQTHNQNEADNWEKPEKSSDLIDLESVMRFTLGAYVDPFISFRLESQFLDGSNPNETKMFNPITLTEAAGAAKVHIKNGKTELTSRLGAAFKQLQSAWVDGLIDENSGGIEYVNNFKTALLKDMVDYDSQLNIYKALYYSESDDANDDWKSVDVNWENNFVMQLYKSVNINLYFQLLYDKELDSDVRVKETLGLGFAYKLF